MSMTTTLYLIRHGETEGGEVRRYKGSIDVPLSEKGIRQMKRVSAFLSAEVQKYKSAKEKFGDETPALLNMGTSALSAVYCSDLARAKRSAEIIAEPHGLTPEIITGLRERSFGIWEGMSFDEIREKYPVEFEAWAGDPLKYSPIGGETTQEVSERCMRSLEGILSRHADGRIVIVSHGGLNRIILAHMLGTPLTNIFRIEQDYGALNIIELSEKYPVVKLINGQEASRR
jgi:broad specificity phosphatase PhoE